MGDADKKEAAGGQADDFVRTLSRREYRLLKRIADRGGLRERDMSRRELREERSRPFPTECGGAGRWGGEACV